MENQIHKGIGKNIVKYFEAANVTGLENTCKRLQALFDEFASKVASLTRSNRNLVMKIDNVSESFTGSSTFVPPYPTTALDIIDELPDRTKRKRNIIVYNLPEPS